MQGSKGLGLRVTGTYIMGGYSMAYRGYRPSYRVPMTVQIHSPELTWSPMHRFQGARFLVSGLGFCRTSLGFHVSLGAGRCWVTRQSRKYLEAGNKGFLTLLLFPNLETLNPKTGVAQATSPAILNSGFRV